MTTHHAAVHRRFSAKIQQVAREQLTPERRPWLAGAGVVIAVGAAALALVPGASLEAPPPPVVAESADDVPPPLPASVLDAPVSYDLAPAIAALEAAVPTTFGDIEARRPHPTNGRVEYAFAAEREPFGVAVTGETAHLTAVIQYRGRGWYRPKIGPTLSASCGTGRESPRAVVRVASTVRLLPDWRLASRSRVEDVYPLTLGKRDRCRVTMFHVDVTDRVLGAARTMVEQRLSALDQRVATLDIRTPVARWWSLLQRPMRLTDSVWLEIRPTSVSVGDVRGRGASLETTIGLAAFPRIVTGERPDSDTTPLPELSARLAPAGVTVVRGSESNDAARAGTMTARGPADGSLAIGGGPPRSAGAEAAYATAELLGAETEGMQVLLEATLDYDVASAILERQLVGKRFARAGHEVQVAGARLAGIGNGRVALEVTFRGDATGRVYLVGTPRLDATASELTVPDLDIDVASEHVLLRAAEWLKRDELRDELRARARWPVGGAVERGRALLAKGLNRRLAPGVHLSAIVGDAVPLGVRATPRTILIRARAAGFVRLDVDRAPGLKGGQ